MVATIKASCIDLIKQVTLDSMNQLESDIIKQVAKQRVNMNKGITNCQTA